MVMVIQVMIVTVWLLWVMWLATLKLLFAEKWLGHLLEDEIPQWIDANKAYRTFGDYFSISLFVMLCLAILQLALHVL